MFTTQEFHWKHSAVGKTIDFDNTPFVIGEKRDLHCQFGDHYFNKKPSLSTKSAAASVTKVCEQPSQPQQVHSTEQSSNEEATCTSTKKSRSRLSLQGTRKIGCKAGIHIREYILYPDYKISTNTENKWQLRKTQEEMLNRLRKDLDDKKPVKTVTKYYFSLPTQVYLRYRK